MQFSCERALLATAGVGQLSVTQETADFIERYYPQSI